MDFMSISIKLMGGSRTEVVAFSGRYRGENSVAAIGDSEHLAAQTIL
jgi:hypothetical protein